MIQSIEILNEFGQLWASWVISGLLGTFLVAVIVSLVWLPLHRRASASLGCWFFLLVALKLFVPLEIPLPNMITARLPQWPIERQVIVKSVPEEPAVFVTSTGVPAKGNDILPEMEFTEAATTTEPVEEATVFLPAASMPVEPQTMVSLSAWLMLTWALTVLVLVAQFIWNEFRFRRLIAASNNVDIPLKELAEAMGIRQTVSVRESDRIAIPAVSGFFRPVILLPKKFVETLPEDELRWILLHELAHIKRFDLSMALLLRLAAMLHFFNPSIWFAAIQIRRLREYACDDLALATLNCENVQKTGGSALLHIVEHARSLHAPANEALGAFNFRTSLKNRLRRLLDTHRTIRTRLGFGSFLVLLLVAAVALPKLTAQQETAQQEAANTGITDTHNNQPEPSVEDKEETIDDLFTELSARLVDEEGNPLGKTFISLVESKENLDKLSRFIEKSTHLNEKAKEHYQSFIRHQGVFTSSNEDGTFKAETFKNGETVLIVDPVILGKKIKNGEVLWIADPVILEKKISATNTFKTTKRGDLGDLILRQGVEPVVRVLTPDGKPLSDVWVNLYPVDERGAGHRGKSDLSYGGKCTFRPMEPGEYTISISKRSGRNANGRSSSPNFAPDVRLVPFAFPEVPVTLTEESKEFTIQALETVTVMLRFQDGKTPNISRWHPDAVFSTLPEEKTGLNWKCTWEEGDTMGGGVYRFRLPKNIPLRFALPRRTSGSLYRLKMPGKSITYPLFEIVRHPALEERNTKIQLRIHPLENDCDFDVFLVEQAEITLRAVDETGKAVENFRVYPEYLHPMLPDGTRSQSDPFAEPALSNLFDGLKQHHSSPTGVLNTPQGLLVHHYDNGTATVSRIHPDEDVRILVYDAEGRTAFTDAKLREGEQKYLTVTVKRIGR